MQAAKPAEQQFEGSAQAKAEAAPLPWTSAEVTTPYTQAPTSTHGKVFFTLGGSDYVCSGTALLSGNKSVVWTAGHCVNEGPGDFATNWEFVPAYKDGARRSASTWPRTCSPPAPGATRATSATTSARRSSRRRAERRSPTVSAVAGSRSTTAASQTYKSYGYPAAPPFNGERLWRCNSRAADQRQHGRTRRRWASAAT